MYDEAAGEIGLAKACYLVAAVSKFMPRARRRCAFKALVVWRTRHPPRQAVAFPRELAVAVVTWLAAVDECAALLRSSEAPFLIAHNLVRVREGFVVVLGRSKRSLEQHIEIFIPSVVAWLDAYLQRQVLRPFVRVAPLTYSRFQTILARHLRCQCRAWRSLTMQRGRWLSEKSAREHVRRGEVALLRARAEAAPTTWRRVERWAAVGPLIWRLV